MTTRPLACALALCAAVTASAAAWAQPGGPARGAAGAAEREEARPSRNQELLLRATATVAAQDALAAAREAASAARWSAQRSEERAVALERSLQALRSDVDANRDSLAALRERFGHLDSRGSLEPVYWTALSLLCALTFWLAMRVRSLQRARQAALLRPSRNSRRRSSASNAAQRDSRSDGASAAAPAAPASVPAAAPGSRAAVPTPRVAPREHAVSADELIDLEQQAEFFLVLGNARAAVDLLTMHLESQEAPSPLVYLKLLEVHWRNQDREAFESVRGRFAAHFDMTAPPWGDGLESGPGLLGDAQSVARVVRSWGDPAAAVSELQALLAGHDGRHLADLPSCRDALLLYSVARDLRDRPISAMSEVDVWLPLDESVAPVARASAPQAPHALDLDLTDPRDGADAEFAPADARRMH